MIVEKNDINFLRHTKGIGETTIGMMMSRTRTIVNRGVKQQLVKYDINPFAYYKIKTAPVREVDLSIENIIKIKNYRPDSKKLKVGKRFVHVLVLSLRNKPC